MNGLVTEQGYRAKARGKLATSGRRVRKARKKREKWMKTKETRRWKTADRDEEPKGIEGRESEDGVWRG